VENIVVVPMVMLPHVLIGAVGWGCGRLLVLFVGAVPDGEDPEGRGPECVVL
jgi:hypothetical protein